MAVARILCGMSSPPVGGAIAPAPTPPTPTPPPVPGRRHSASHGGELRKGRWSQPGHVYLLTAKTQKRLPLFADFSRARSVIAQLRRESVEGNADTIAFVVMPDHMHWLVVLKQGTLSALMGRVKRRALVGLDISLRESFPVGPQGASRIRWWQEGFHDHALRGDESLLASARYIVANPLRAGLCTRVGDYPHWDAAWLHGRDYL